MKFFASFTPTQKKAMLALALLCTGNYMGGFFRTCMPYILAQYQALGLNSKQISIIAQATPKRDYYVASRNGRRLMQLALGPKTLAFVGASGKDDIAKVRELVRVQAGDWPEAWLEYKQVA